MGINTERDIEANLQIGPTDAGMVRLFIAADAECKDEADAAAELGRQAISPKIKP